jgi:hypothetical protein
VNRDVLNNNSSIGIKCGTCIVGIVPVLSKMPHFLFIVDFNR